MPLWPEYVDEMKGNHADLKNSAGRWGSACTAAAFLSQFVGGHPRWAHLDIAGPAISARPRQATGYGVALTLRWLQTLTGGGRAERVTLAALPDGALLEIDDLTITLPGRRAARVEVVRVGVVRGRAGEMVGLVGESGSGKTMTALAIMRLVPAPGAIAGGAHPLRRPRPAASSPSARCARCAAAASRWSSRSR